MKRAKLLLPLFILGTLFLFSCAEETDDDNRTTIQMEITDAPVDNANVSAVFVTVTDIKIDGESFAGFSGKQTIDIYALQNGRTEALGMSETEAKAYSNIELILDTETDASGNAPGCYVLTAEGMKDNLYTGISGTKTIRINKPFNAESQSSNRFVIDFDLRKTIQSNGNSDYEFASDATMNASLRLIKRNQAGSISGSINGNIMSSGKVVVYAYNKGSYNANTQATSATDFSGAVTSCNVDAAGNYTLSFMEEGEYEIVCASYNDDDNDGSMELQGTLSVDLLLGLDSSLATVSAESNTTLNISIEGLLPL